MFQSMVRQTTVGGWSVAGERMSGVGRGRERAHPRHAGQRPWLGSALAVLVGALSGQACEAAEIVADDKVTIQSDIAIRSPVLSLLQYNLGNTVYEWQVTGYPGSFLITNVTGNKIPFKIAADTPEDTLRLVQNGGQSAVGIGGPPSGTLVNLQIFNTDTAKIRLTRANPNPTSHWDIGANDQSFFVYNATLDHLPFEIVAGAPDDSLFVSSTGNVGMGTSTPSVINSTSTGGQCLNVRSAASVARLVGQGQTGSVLDMVHLGGATANQKHLRLLNQNGFARFQVVKDNLSALAVSDALVIKMSDGNIGLRVANPTNPLQLASGARCTAAGVWTNASSRDFKQDIEPITSEQARDTVRALQPVGYRYRNELDERYVGFIAEDVPELVATNDRKGLAPMDIVAVLTKVVQDQDQQLVDQGKQLAEERQRIDKERQRNDKQERLIESLMQRLADLEQRSVGAAPTK